MKNIALKKLLIPTILREGIIFVNIKRINVKWIGQGDTITGYLLNLKQHRILDEQKNEVSCLLMFFVDERGDYYKAIYKYEPYFHILVRSDSIR